MGLLDRLRGKPTRHDFAAMLMQAFRRAGETRELQYDRDSDRILLLEGGKPVNITNLSNMYATYLEKPGSEKTAYLRSCVRVPLHSSRTLPEDFESARPDLRVKIWSRAGVEAQRLKAKLDGMGNGLELAGVPVGEHLIASLAYDWPESTQSVPPAALQGWGVTLDEAMEAGKHNLAETMLGYSKIGDNLVAFVSGDSYDACRILLVDQIRDMGLSGRPVAIVPNRDTAYVTGEDDEVGLMMMAKLAADAMSDQYGLSGVPLVLDGDRWVNWMPPASHPAYAQFRDLELKTLGPAYHEQEQLLNAIHERDGIDVFVATLSAVQKEGGNLVSYCVWGRGVDSLLPVADKVILISKPGEDPVANGVWDQVREVVGGLMEQTDDYPPRFRVREFPSEEALAAIGKGEI